MQFLLEMLGFSHLYSKNSSLERSFFKTIPPHLWEQKEKYIPLEIVHLIQSRSFHVCASIHVCPSIFLQFLQVNHKILLTEVVKCPKFWGTKVERLIQGNKITLQSFVTLIAPEALSTHYWGRWRLLSGYFQLLI